MKRIILLLLLSAITVYPVFATWPSDVKTVLLFENNLNDDTGTYTWTTFPSGMLYSSSVKKEGNYSAGEFPSSASTYGAKATIAESIKTVQFWLNVSGSQVERGCFTIGSAHFAWGDFSIQIEKGALNIWQKSVGFYTTKIPFNDYGNWHLIQITFDGTYITMYQDGTQVFQAANTYIPPALRQYSVCQRYLGDRSFYGYMDNFIISTKNYAGETITEILGTPTPWPDYYLNNKGNKDIHYQGPRMRWYDYFRRKR